jgi:uncharacterized membrane protein YfcA
VGTGLYAGFLGAGISILITALLRFRSPADVQIAHIKIQARFVEFLLVIATVIAHAYHGNLILKVWLAWSLGTFIGGYFGGKFLTVMKYFSGNTQKLILRASFAFAIIVAGVKFFG